MDDPQQPADFGDSTDDGHERRDATARVGDLRGMAGAAEDATFGETDTGRKVVPGVLSGEVGPKGQVSGQMRSLSRVERATYGEVPRGSVAPGGAKLLLVPMLAFGFGILALVALVGWLAR